MSGITVRTEEVLREERWEYRDEDLAFSSHNSPQEILTAYVASLQEPSAANRLVVNTHVRHRDERGTDCMIGLHFIVEEVTPVSLDPSVWVFAGPATDLRDYTDATRVKLLFTEDKLALVTLTKTSPVLTSR